MQKEVFNVLLEQAEIGCRNAVKVVLSSSIDEEFLQSKFLRFFPPLYLSCRHTDKYVDYLSLARLINGAIEPSLKYSLVASPAWCYSATIKPESMHTAFPRLLGRAIRGYVTTFRSSGGSTDGLIRVIFDQNLFRSLFSLAETDTMDAGEHVTDHNLNTYSLKEKCFSVGCAVKNQIIVAFGEDVFEAITSSQTWTQETWEIETGRLRVDYTTHNERSV